MRAGGASHDLSLADFEGVDVYHRCSDDSDAHLASMSGVQEPARNFTVRPMPMVGTASSVEAPVADWRPIPFAPPAMGELQGVGAYEEGAPPWIAPTIAGAGVAMLLGVAWFKGYL